MIPTAEELLDNNIAKHNIPWSQDVEKYYGAINASMIEFAKIHVQAALEAAADKAEAKENPLDYGCGGIWVDPQSILKSYPLSNIK